MTFSICRTEVLRDILSRTEVLRYFSGTRVLRDILGTGLGADPIGVLLRGGLGTFLGVLGVALLLAGRCWTRALLARAAGAGTDR